MSHAPPAVELRSGALRLALRPDLGGSISGLWFDATPVLRSTEPAGLESARLAGSYPLLPYSNHIADGRFNWRGRQHQLPVNDPPHALHGVGLAVPWRVEHAAADEASLLLEHPAGAAWPFAFEARQRFMLSPDALLCEMSVVNHAAHEAPVGLGWHPFFPKRARSHLRAEVAGRWEMDDRKLPCGRVPVNGLDADIARLDLDHCFDGWSGQAALHDELFALTLSSSLRHLVVYTPHDKDAYAVEPVSHVNNAINQAEPPTLGLQVLAPGAATSAWMKLAIRPQR